MYGGLSLFALAVPWATLQFGHTYLFSLQPERCKISKKYRLDKFAMNFLCA